MNVTQILKCKALSGLKGLNLPNLRGISGQWIEDTLYLKFYFNGEISEDDIEEAWEISTEIIAAFSDGFLNEECIRCDYPHPLPQQHLIFIA